MRKLLALLALLPGLADAAMKVAVVQAAAGTGTPTFTQDFTDSTTFGGATPKCAIVLGSAATANNSSTANIQQNIGFVSASAQASTGISDNDATSPSTASYANYSTQAYSLPDFGGNTAGDATGAMIANGVRLSWTDQSQGELVKVILIGGDVECAVSSLTSNNGTSAQAVTHGLTAAPQFVMAMSPGTASGDNTGTARQSIGFYDGTNQKSLGVVLNNGGVTTVASFGRISSTTLLASKASATNFNWTATIGNVGATTFDITMSAATTNLMHFLSLRSTSGTALAVKVGTFGTKTSTGTAADISGMSQAPQLALYALSRSLAVDTNYSGADDASVLGLGAAVKNTGTGSTQYATIVNCSVDGAATSTNHAYSQTSNTEVIRIPDANASCAADVEATINSWDSGGVTNNYSAVSTSARQIVYAAIGGNVAAPTWSVSPTVSAQDTNDYTLSATPSTSCTWYAVACAKDSTAPTEAQLEAGHCTGDAAAIASASKAISGADTLTLGGSLIRPVHDVYTFCKNGAGDTNITTLADECLDAPAGKTFVGGCPNGLTSIHANSPINDFNSSVTPDIVAGDIMVADSATDLGDALTWTATGLYSYDGNSARRKFSANFYDLSAGANHADTMQVCVNNAAPVASVAYYDALLVKDHPFTAIDFCTMFSDADDPTLTCTSDEAGAGTGAGTRPAGTTMTAGVFDDTGAGATSADASTGSLNITATDSCGDTATIPFGWSVYSQVTVPDCVAGSLSSCMTALSAVNLDTSFESQCSATVAALNVISQTPAASTVVDPFTGVSLVVSSGPCGGRRGRLMLGIGVR